MSVSIEQSSRIWLDPDDSVPDTYVRFRRCFELAAVPPHTVLHIVAETEFSLHVNGCRVPATQFPDYPAHKTYASINVAPYLRIGHNVLAVLVYHLGHGNATHPLCPAGLRLSLELPDRMPLLSDDNWRTSLSEAYASGEKRRLSVPIGYQFNYDASGEDDWIEVDYDDSQWKPAVILPCPADDGSWAELSLRPIPCLLEAEPGPVNVIWQGETLRLISSRDEWSPGVESQEPFLRYREPEAAFDGWKECWNCTRDDSASPYPIPLGKGKEPLILLPPSPGADGISVIVDLGRETAGFPVLEFQCGDDDDLIVEIHHGEHLQDGRVRSVFRNLHYRFIDTYKPCGSRAKRFTHPLRRIAGRYLQLFFLGKATQPIRLFYAGVAEVAPPLPEVRPFESDYALQAPVRELAVRTLFCCMHDHYEDCPLREQSLYPYDSRFQMLYGYYVWGNYDFAQASLNLLAGGYRSASGHLAICAPSSDPYLIPAYTCSWITAVAEFVLFSGRIEFFEKHRELIDRILSMMLGRPDPEHVGLYLPGTDENIWNFYEWCYELANDKQQPQALYNAYLLEALQNASRMHAWGGDLKASQFYADHVEKLAYAINRWFWDSLAQCYTEFIPSERINQRYYEHLQALMLCLDVVRPEQKSSLLNRILCGTLEPCTYSSLLYYVRALIRETPEIRELVEQRLRTLFEPPLRKDATTLWELADAVNAPRFGGSLCHGWSAVPVYFAGACNLGVYPVQPGFREFIVKPYPGSLKHASGRVPTPHGDITVKWDINDNAGDIDIQVFAPKGLRYTVERFSENLRSEKV